MSSVTAWHCWMWRSNWPRTIWWHFLWQAGTPPFLSVSSFPRSLFPKPVVSLPFCICPLSLAHWWLQGCKCGSKIWAGVLVLWGAWAHQGPIPHDGRGVIGPGPWYSTGHPQISWDALHTCKYPRGYLSCFGGFGVQSNLNSPVPGSRWGTGYSMMGEGKVGAVHGNSPCVHHDSSSGEKA